MQLYLAGVWPWRNGGGMTKPLTNIALTFWSLFFMRTKTQNG